MRSTLFSLIFATVGLVAHAQVIFTPGTEFTGSFTRDGESSPFYEDVVAVNPAEFAEFAVWDGSLRISFLVADGSDAETLSDLEGHQFIVGFYNDDESPFTLNPGAYEISISGLFGATGQVTGLTDLISFQSTDGFDPWSDFINHVSFSLNSSAGTLEISVVGTPVNIPSGAAGVVLGNFTGSAIPEPAATAAIFGSVAVGLLLVRRMQARIGEKA